MGKNKKKLHDEFFKVTFSDRQIAAGYIRQFVDKELVGKLDLSKLKIENTSYTTKVLKKYFSDIVYTCPYQDTTITITFLFEHKSDLEPYPHVQLLRYIVEIWQTDIKEKRPLQIVLPLVFYHGEKNWEYRSIDDYFPVMDKALLRYIPRFDYHFLDISQWSDERIIALREAFLVNTLLVLKHVRDENYILHNVRTLFLGLDAYMDSYRGKNLFYSIVVYLFEHSNFDEQKIAYMIDQMESPLHEEAMSTYDRIVAKGREEGLEEGLEKGLKKGLEKGLKEGDKKRIILATENMLKASIPPATIADFLGISEEEVNAIIEQLQEKG